MRISTEIWHKISYSRDDITVIIISLNPPCTETNTENESNNRNSKYTETQD